MNASNDKHHSTTGSTAGEHIVDRLRARIREVRAMGFHVRQEVLGAHQPNWCELGGKKVLFLDASQTARDQLASIEEALAGYRSPELHRQ
jgi:hypothetical protein